MKRKPLINKHGEARELTREDFRHARPAREAEPALAAWSLRRQRAKKGEAKKKAVSLRLSPEVLTFFKSKGQGWQTRIDHILKAFVQASR